MIQLKSFKILCGIALLLSLFQTSSSQTLNINNLKKENKNIVSLYTGLEYGLVFGVGYGYKLNSNKPIILGVEFSIPAGDNPVDDFKTKFGGQIVLHRDRNFYFSGKVQGIFRQNSNDYVRLQNFGAEVSGTMGYFKRKWFTALDIGFDKAIVTRFTHSGSYKLIHPGVQDGWYEPATGGNLNLGVQVGYSFKHNDLYIKGGKLATQSFSNPSLPFYALIGYAVKF